MGYAGWRYYAFRLVGTTLSYFPRRIGYLIAHIVADMVYILSPRLRNIITENIRHVLGPEADQATLKKTTRAVLRNTAKNYFDLIKLPRLKIDDIGQSMITHDWHHFDEAFEKGKGVLIVTAHLGSFDLAVQIFASLSIKVTILVESLESAPLLNHVTNLRGSKGLTFVPAHSGAFDVFINTLRRGEVALLVCDRDIANNGLKLNFFGEETTLPANAALAAMRTGAAVVPMFNIRRDDGRYDVYVEPPVDIIPAGKGALLKNTIQIASILEKYIKKYPEQWVVLSPIWPANQQ